MSTDFFIQRPAVTPTIYVYTLPGVASHTGYRVAKTTVMEYIMDRRTPGGYKKCVGSVTSNHKGWTCDKKSDMLCFAKAKEVC